MLRYSEITSLPTRARAVALGVFDGIHIGHRAVISAACGVRHSLAEGPFLAACVLSLDGVPKHTRRLTADRDIDEICETLGVDEWLSLPFDEVRALSPARFVRDILYDRLQARAVCCGEDYRFGRDGSGDAALLKQLCEPLGIAVTVLPSIRTDGEPVSTTRILEALSQGDMPLVRRLSGRPYFINETVIHGNHIGHKWGFPTVNQPLDEAVFPPRFGVYASLVTLDGVCRKAVTNIGLHPTVGNAAQAQAETWIADFDGDLYGQVLKVELVRFLRDERRFDSAEQLKAQIECDRAQALSYLSGQPDGGIRAILFDFDDTLQDRRAAFSAAAEELLRRYMPSATDAEIDERAAVMLAENAGGYVNYPAYFADMYARWRWDGVDSPQALHREYLQCFPSHTTLFAESAELLAQLRQRGYKLGIITNGSRLLQNRKLDISELRFLFDITVVSGDEGVHKPDAELFRRAAMRLGLAPSQCVYVGDHPVNDIAGAHSAGMHTVFVESENYTPPVQAEMRVKRCAELLAHF